jgi:hypothetical protein
MRAAVRKRAVVAPTFDSVAAPLTVHAGRAKPAPLSLSKFSFERATLSSAQLAEAREHHLRWLATVSRWLRVDETKVKAEDRKLVDRVKATIGDGAAFERALGYPPVDQLFARGVLHFQRPA